MDEQKNEQRYRSFTLSGGRLPKAITPEAASTTRQSRRALYAFNAASFSCIADGMNRR
jgi:hypothetical protein